MRNNLNSILEQIFFYGLIGFFIVLMICLIIFVFKFLLILLSIGLVLGLMFWLFFKIKELINGKH